MQKIVISGPESTGKTTLARSLARVLKTEWVPEYAREFITKLNRPYVENDLLEIARGQLLEEEKRIKKARQYLICDTDLITIKIWSEVKYNRCDQEILYEIEKRHYDLYLLMYPDFSWTYDPLRENPDDQQLLYSIYKTTLEAYGKDYIEMKGNEKERLEQALNILSNR